MLISFITTSYIHMPGGGNRKNKGVYMYLVLSPAKRLHDVTIALQGTEPFFWSESRKLAKYVQDLSAVDLEKMMGISSTLGVLNHARFQSLSMTQTVGTPAIQTFAGDTFIGLEAHSLSKKDIEWAQNRIGILSGLYGVLRPLDVIEPYRLEMGTKLKTEKGSNLYSFWGESVHIEVAKRVKETKYPTLINLASVEYFSVLKGIGVPVINPIFKEEKNGKYKVIALNSKRARGSMARFVIDERIENPTYLKSFNYGGYSYSQEQSTQQNWVFLR